MADWLVERGDMRAVLATYPEAEFSACVTDPPYELGFMGKSWDSSGVAFDPDTWRAVFRVLKPGGHLLAFGGTRTYHRIACAIEDAGFEIRDCLSWLYGTGFPKSLNVGESFRKAGPGLDCGPLAEQWKGWGTALKPAWEPIILARKPLDDCTVIQNVGTHGTGALNIDATRVGTDTIKTNHTSYNGVEGWAGNRSTGATSEHTGRWPANLVLDEEAAATLDEQSGNRPGMSGGGKHRDDYEGGMFGAIDGNAGHARGDKGGASRFFYTAKTSASEREAGLDALPRCSAGDLTDREDGSDGLKSPRAGAGRSSKGRANHHPTVKPISLMRWLVRLVTPPGGLVLDPFCGSGSTGCAAVLEGFPFLGIELTDEYIPIATARIAHWSRNGNVAA